LRRSPAGQETACRPDKGIVLSMKIPLTTYRLQFCPDFDFDQARGTLAYLYQLGVTDIYASPVFAAKSGSIHGYDIVDPTKINPEWGGEEALRALIRDAKGRGLGWLQDIVPNHMAYDPQNPFLMDIFEYGEGSAYRGYFDIDWDHPYENLKNRLLAPFLGQFYGKCVDQQEIRLIFNERGFFFQYYDFFFPLKIASYGAFLEKDLEGCSEGFLKVVEGFKGQAGRREQARRLKSELWKLYGQEGAVRRHIEASLKRINGRRGNPGSFNELDALLSTQNFRFAFWKVGNEELNYRRFFTINGLLCLKTEEQDVFEFAHSLIFQWLREGLFTCLRIDHLDGLYDPIGYLSRLRQKAPDTYIAAEKILDIFELLCGQMPIQGTTGYDFLNICNGLFVDRKQEKRFDRAYALFSGMSLKYGELLSQKKRLFTGQNLAGDIDNLARLLKTILGKDRYGHDLTLYGLRRGLVEMLVYFPVYRTYIAADPSMADEAYVKEAAARAVNHHPGLRHELAAVERVLLFKNTGGSAEMENKNRRRFTARFQQTSSVLAAKGMEDTAFYVYNRLLSLNEVGGNPSVFGISRKDFHEFNARRREFFPYSMNAGSTHDTKRGEDARARLNVLSEIPGEWARLLKAWEKSNRRNVKHLASVYAPGKNDEYFIYQTLLGAWPFRGSGSHAFRERVKAYIVKAIREAKVHTAWLEPDTAYEEACVAFVEDILNPQRSPEFLSSFTAFQKKIAFYGLLNSLSQTLLRLTAPGVPDIYQGAELWDLSLVDPDNRRPVDFKKRARMLEDIRKKEAKTEALIRRLWAEKEEGGLKLFLIYRLLKTRGQYPGLFLEGAYLPLKAEGSFARHVVAFSRRSGQRWAVAVAPRFLTGLVREGRQPLGMKVWRDTLILLPKEAPVQWKDVITGVNIARGREGLFLGKTLGLFSAALLISK